MNIELNEQQVKFLEEYLMYVTESGEWLSNSSRAIIDSIINKLQNENNIN